METDEKENDKDKKAPISKEFLFIFKPHYIKKEHRHNTANDILYKQLVFCKVVNLWFQITSSGINSMEMNVWGGENKLSATRFRGNPVYYARFESYSAVPYNGSGMGEEILLRLISVLQW